MQANDLRQHLTIDPSIIHLNNAGVGPMTRPAQEAIAGMAALQGDQAAAVPEMIAIYEASRKFSAVWWGFRCQCVNDANLCRRFIPGGLLSYQVGDNILCDQEYPSNAYPWFEAARRNSVEAKVIDSETNLDLQLEQLYVQSHRKPKW